jgi:hypothetical protein
MTKPQPPDPSQQPPSPKYSGIMLRAANDHRGPTVGALLAFLKMFLPEYSWVSDEPLTMIAAYAASGAVPELRIYWKFFSIPGSVTAANISVKAFLK